ncbi:hypothetical protein [Actinomadura atramentaria]|uniref:hypothetical protein n=1 Tax=Actinomadura atramentaria TaxID=1990 RepID=UPI00036B7E87|nr:hypothetical protein [Actinomadura atramentaria]
MDERRDLGRSNGEPPDPDFLEKLARGYQVDNTMLAVSLFFSLLLTVCGTIGLNWQTVFPFAVFLALVHAARRCLRDRRRQRAWLVGSVLFVEDFRGMVARCDLATPDTIRIGRTATISRGTPVWLLLAARDAVTGTRIRYILRDTANRLPREDCLHLAEAIEAAPDLTGDAARVARDLRELHRDGYVRGESERVDWSHRHPT